MKLNSALSIKDHYPFGYCKCEGWIDPTCHLHGTEPCLGCLIHHEGRTEVLPVKRLHDHGRVCFESSPRVICR
jgi:hypothetical protein